MLKVTFRQLEAFYWAATLGTVKASARHLFVSQPAITARVKELEDLLGFAVLSRSQQGVRLTPAGREVLEDARRLLQLAEDFERRAQHEVPPLDGILRLGADESAAAVAVSELLHQLRLRFPGLRVDVSIERSRVLHKKFNRREIDVALQTSPVERPHVRDELLGRVNLAWVAGATLELSHLPLTPCDALTQPVVTHTPPSLLHQVTHQWLSQAGADLHRLNTCNSLATIVKLVQEGQAISPLPVPVVLEKLKIGAVKLVGADPPLPPLCYYVSWLADKEAAGVGAIVGLAKDVLRSTRFLSEAVD